MYTVDATVLIVLCVCVCADIPINQTISFLKGSHYSSDLEASLPPAKLGVRDVTMRLARVASTPKYTPNMPKLCFLTIFKVHFRSQESRSHCNTPDPQLRWGEGCF